MREYVVFDDTPGYVCGHTVRPDGGFEVKHCDAPSLAKSFKSIGDASKYIKKIQERALAHYFVIDAESAINGYENSKNKR